MKVHLVFCRDTCDPCCSDSLLVAFDSQEKADKFVAEKNEAEKDSFQYYAIAMEIK